MNVKAAQKKEQQPPIDRLLAILKGGKVDYDAEDYRSPDELFREAIAAEWPKGTRWPKGKTGFVECGSAGRWSGKIRVKDTPRGLYRLLYLVRPKKVDFSDMYKSGLFSFFSADLRFMVTVDLFKYELGLYFYCRRDLLEDRQAGQAFRVMAGAPGSDNGARCTDPEGRKFFEMVTRAAKFKWMVYGGNDFEV